MMQQPFKITIEEAVLIDLKQHLKNTRWTDAVENIRWEYGTDLTYLFIGKMILIGANRKII